MVRHILLAKTSADITLKSLGEVIHLEQNNQGTWQANHTSINKVHVRKGDLDDITLQLYTEADYASFAYPSIQDTMTIGPNAYDDMVIQSLMNAIIIKDFQSIQESQYVRIVHDKNTDVYINYELQEQLTNKAYIGDHIYVEGIWLEVQADGLNVLSQNTVASSLIRLTQEMPHAQADDYIRTIVRQGLFTVNRPMILRLKDHHNQYRRTIQ